MLKQLTGLDASFLYMETASSFGHVNGLAIYERPDDPNFDAYEAVKVQLESRLHMLEPFRRRLVEVPLGLDHPYWINDPDFDIDFHIRHIAIPPPGNHEQLAAQVSRIIGRPMDRTRPLWEVYVMEGLADNQWALLSKTHHATIDGAAGVEMMKMMFDASPEGDEIPPDDGSWKPDNIPSDLELMNRTAWRFFRQPARMARVQLKAMQQMADITRNKGMSRMLDSARSQMPRRNNDTNGGQAVPTGPAPKTPFNKAITAHRRLSLGSVPLDDIKALKTELDATVNDVVMAICAGALRRYLQHHDALPDEPLRSMVPVSIRTGDETEKWTNRVSQLFVELPTNVDDPLERVKVVHDAMVAAKEQFELVPADALVDMTEFSSPALAVQSARLASSLRLADRTDPVVNVVISNVPGPREPLYVAGSRLSHYYPVSTITDGVGLNITVHSYLDTLDIGLVACRELIPDLDYLIDLHLEEIDTLFAATGLARTKAASAKSTKSSKARSAKGSKSKRKKSGVKTAGK